MVKFSKERRRAWNVHVDRIPKMTRDDIPEGKRKLGRKAERWAQSWIASSIDSPEATN